MRPPHHRPHASTPSTIRITSLWTATAPLFAGEHSRWRAPVRPSGARRTCVIPPMTPPSEVHPHQKAFTCPKRFGRIVSHRALICSRVSHEATNHSAYESALRPGRGTSSLTFAFLGEVTKSVKSYCVARVLRHLSNRACTDAILPAPSVRLL